jgi:hypothetical protein
MAAFYERTSGLGMLARSRKHSLFALFSPKLWTAMNQYGAGGPCIIGLREWSPGVELENMSLDQFELEDAASAKAEIIRKRRGPRSPQLAAELKRR